MATTKKKTTKPADTKKTIDDQVYQQFLTDIGRGQDFANQFLNGEYLGRINELRTPEQQELLDRSRAESFIGGYNSPEVTASLNSLKKLTNPNAVPGNQHVDRGLNALSSLNATAGNVDPRMAESLNFLRGDVDKYAALDPLVQEAIDRARSGLGGLNSAENVALNEQALAGANQDFNSANRALAAATGGSFARGGAANALSRSIANDYAKSLAAGRQNQLLANIDIQNQRSAAYNDLVNSSVGNLAANRANATGAYNAAATTAAANQFAQRQSAAANYANTANSVYQNRFQNSLNAGNAYANAMGANQEANRADRAGRLNAYSNLLASTNADTLNRQIYNQQQGAAENAARMTAYLGVPQYLNTAREGQQGLNISQEQLNYFKSK